MNEMIQLLNGTLKGDTRSFDRLYELTHQKAYYVALKYMKDEHQAEDVLQEAYIKAFNNLTHYKMEINLNHGYIRSYIQQQWMYIENEKDRRNVRSILQIMKVKVRQP